MPLTFNVLLKEAEIPLSEVRLLRHQDSRAISGRTPYELWRDDKPAFDLYQACQNFGNRERLSGVYWASFVVFLDETLFAGLYKVGEVASLTEEVVMPTTGEIRRPGPGSDDFYALTPCDSLSDFIGRLVIDWGAASRVWIQRAENQDKAVIEVRRNFQEPAFPGYLAFSTQLSQLLTLPASWKTALSAGRGVYILTCPRTKEQYIGSATGEAGFYQRWGDYAANGHGGNIALKSLDPSDYQISILELAGSSASDQDILAMESRWKAKLQSREMGLNRN